MVNGAVTLLVTHEAEAFLHVSVSVRLGHAVGRGGVDVHGLIESATRPGCRSTMWSVDILAIGGVFLGDVVPIRHLLHRPICSKHLPKKLGSNRAAETVGEEVVVIGNPTSSSSGGIPELGSCYSRFEFVHKLMRRHLSLSKIVEIGDGLVEVLVDGE